jgi:hypothetical protein
MKPFYFVTYLSLFLGLCACDPDSDVPPKSGGEYEVVVVMNNIAWDGNSGALIRKQLSTPVPFLRQDETEMNVKYLIPEQFNDSTKYARNILIVTIDKIEFPSVSYKRTTNKWSNDQVIFYINTPDEQALETFLTQNNVILLNYFTSEEMSRAKYNLVKSHSAIVLDEVKKKFDITVFVPADITSCKDTADCLWFSNNAAVGRTDLLIYSVPYESEASLSFVNLINKRDSIAKIMIPGLKPGTYMKTDRNNVNYSTTTLLDKDCTIIRGLWELQGDRSISGPFVSYARVDKLNHRIIVAEGFVYEPVQKKRNYIRTLEAALQTLRFPGEPEQESGPEQKK